MQQGPSKFEKIRGTKAVRLLVIILLIAVVAYLFYSLT